MSRLADTEFWANSLNQIAPLTPALGNPINAGDAAKIRQIACRTLTLLLDDPEYPKDLANAVAQAKTATAIDATDTPQFVEFLDRFVLLESKILADARVDTVASRDLEREIRIVAKAPDARRLEQLADKIAFLQRLACDPDAVDDPKRPLWMTVWRGVKGVALIGIDVGSAAGATLVLGPGGAAAIGTVAGISAGYGAAFVSDALKGRW